MFDRTDFPYHITFVREAIQNSLDARLDLRNPVTVNFNFFSDNIGPRQVFLDEIMSHRESAGLSIPDEWKNGCVKWLVVEDFNSTGLLGDIKKRTSDFWNYWLNFGISNKDGSGRGGRGIGRVTFLIASQVQSVIGYTRRHTDTVTAICGMCVLRAKEDGENVLSTHAYLAEEIEGNIYRLYSSPSFDARTRESFFFTGYDCGMTSGLGLAILYPHKELKSDIILTAAIENFAPAIMSESLRLNVDGLILDASSIEKISSDLSHKMNEEAIRGNSSRYLRLIKQTASDSDAISFSLPSASKFQLNSLKNSKEAKRLQKKIAENESVAIEVKFPLERNNKTTVVSIRAAVAPTSSGTKPIDRLFREGMSLPEVRAKNPGELDLILLVEDKLLATYLNLCEGKAHLDLLESKDVRQKLDDSGFPDIRVKRLVKSLPAELRLLVTPDIIEPDDSVFDSFFSVPTKKKENRPRPDKPDNPQPTPVPPPPRQPVVKVNTLNDGLRISANPEFTDWPVSVAIRIAYADGTRRPSWSPFDFQLGGLVSQYSGCKIEIERNRIKLLNCGPDTEIDIVGFDPNRELDATIRTLRNA